jgi:hypothetical protein
VCDTHVCESVVKHVRNRLPILVHGTSPRSGLQLLCNPSIFHVTQLARSSFCRSMYSFVIAFKVLADLDVGEFLQAALIFSDDLEHPAPSSNRWSDLCSLNIGTGMAVTKLPCAPPSGTEERYRISRDLCSANEAYRAGIFREFPIVGQQRNALHSRLSHKDAIERVLVSGR